MAEYIAKNGVRRLMAWELIGPCPHKNGQQTLVEVRNMRAAQDLMECGWRPILLTQDTLGPLAALVKWVEIKSVGDASQHHTS